MSIFGDARDVANVNHLVIDERMKCAFAAHAVRAMRSAQVVMVDASLVDGTRALLTNRQVDSAHDDDLDNEL